MSVKTKLEWLLFQTLGAPTCEELESLAYDFLEGNLDDKTHRSIEKHMRLCPSCLKFIKSYRRTRSLGAEIPTPSLDPAFQNHLMKLFQKT